MDQENTKGTEREQDDTSPTPRQRANEDKDAAPAPVPTIHAVPAPLPASVPTPVPLRGPLPSDTSAPAALMPAPIPTAPGSARAPMPGSVAHVLLVPAAPPLLPPSTAPKPYILDTRPSHKMRHLAWKPLKRREIKGTMFEDITIDEDKIAVDVAFLESAWAASNLRFRNETENKTEDRAPTINRLINVILENPKSGMQRRAILMAITRYGSRTLDQLMEDMKNIEYVNDLEYVRKMGRVVPTYNERVKFKRYFAKTKMDRDEIDAAVRKMPLERLCWFLVKNDDLFERLWFQSLRLEVDEFCEIQYGLLKSLDAMVESLRDNVKIAKIMELSTA